MKIQELLEAAQDDLIRKLNLLTAMYLDKSATDGEKANAKVLIAKLKHKLEQEYGLNYNSSASDTPTQPRYKSYYRTTPPPPTQPQSQQNPYKVYNRPRKPIWSSTV